MIKRAFQNDERLFFFIPNTIQLYMRSFRTEIENPIVERDIIELEQKIRAFKEGKVDEERFRSLRLARGVYGQRQQGVQMIRIKIPFGKLSAKQLLRICDVSEEYSTGRLHITTRQDIQIHNVLLDRTPELWAELEQDDITLREACGNTVRNITASDTAGIDTNEPFDPRPYADAVFKYFLRNPICQEMGRKFKVSFSNTDEDSAFAFMHDLGFIAKTKEIDGKLQHGFKVMIGGGLGSQSIHAHLYDEFVPVNEIISLMEATLRTFERYGERNRRMKARMKFLIKDLGYETFKAKLDEERKILSLKKEIPYQEEAIQAAPLQAPKVEETEEFKLWKKHNTFAQKQVGYFAIGLKVRLGDLFTKQARPLARLVNDYAGNELTLSIHQNALIRHVKEADLPFFHESLKKIGLADIGYLKFRDLTACPGTDTCNLGIASSTGLAEVLETVLAEEYPDFADENNLLIKLSGCMNACGQHMISAIGFQGMTIRTKDKRVMPAAQVLLGGGVLGDGQGRFADKVIKVPAKRATDALRVILNDLRQNGISSDGFLDYYDQQGEKYFYDILKHLGNLDNIQADDFIDWGHSTDYIKAIGVGECAGVVIDLITTLLFESEEKLERAKRALEEGIIRDSIYHAYTSMVNTAKALLLADEHKTNTQAGIINLFDEHFVQNGLIELNGMPFTEYALRMKTVPASPEFAEIFYNDALDLYAKVDAYRLKQLTQ